MFRTGGPIKEGIMNGLKDGGVATYMADATMMAGGGLSKQFNTGLVGDERYPKTGGREHHYAFLAPVGAGLFNIARTALMPFGRLGMKKVLRSGLVRGAGNTVRGGLGRSRIVTPADMTGKKLTFDPNRFGAYFTGSPEGKFITGQGGKISKAIYGGLKKGLRSPTVAGLTAAGFTDIFPGVKHFRPDKYLPNIFGQRFDADGNKVEGPLFGKVKSAALTKTDTGERGSRLKTDGTEKVLSAAEKEAKDKERLNKVYKLLGVDRAQRNAASKALIDVSRYIDEQGKEAISKKNIGSTISKAISSFDKRLDKVDQLKEAAGVMMAKNYLEGGDKELDRNLKIAKLNALNREADPSISNLKAVYNKAGVKDPAGAAAQEKFGSAYGGALMTTKDFNKQMKEFEGQQIEEKTILDIATNAVKNLEMAAEGAFVDDGYYKVGENIVLIEGGVAKSIVG